MSIKITSLLRLTVFIILVWCIGIVPTLEGNAVKKDKEISQKNISKKVQPSVEPKSAGKKDQVLSNSKKKVKKINEINQKISNGIKFSYTPNSNEVVVLYERKKHKIDEIINIVKEAGMEIYDISTDEGNLESVFIDLTKN